MSDNQIQMYFDDLNERISRINGLVSIILDTVGKQTSDIGLLKTRVDSLNDTVNSELRGDKIYEIMRRNSEEKTDENEGDLLSRLNSKDKMND